MANTLTALAPVLYSVAQEVSEEPFGIISAIDMRFDNKGVADGDTVYVPIAPKLTTSSYTPAMTTTAGADAVASSVGISISANNTASWNLTGEQARSLQNGGDNYVDWLRQLVRQGMRALRNGAETAAWTEIYKSASRAYGTAGTTPFATDLSALTNARKILQDNGAPLADLQFVGNTAAGLNLRNLGVIQNAYQAGTDQERRSGQLLRQFGFEIRESAAVGVHTKGTATGLDNVGGAAVGDTSISLDGGDGGTLLAGDVVTFAADSANKYVVSTGFTAASGTAVLGRPGTRVAITAADEMTIGASYTANLAFERSAVVGIMRAPFIPENPLITQLPISDGMGMNYLLCEIAGDGMTTWRMHLAYGFKTVQEEHVALVLG